MTSERGTGNSQGGPGEPAVAGQVARRPLANDLPDSACCVPCSRVPVVLTIAGSDSGGGAGIQADLKTFEALGCFGTSAITCVTAQNPDEVRGVAAVDPEMVALQMRAVCEGFPVAAAKTGMLYSAPIIRAVVRTLREAPPPHLVVDPVMVATSSARLLREDAVDALRSELLGAATVLTPNIPEAEILWGESIPDAKALRCAARELGKMFGTACVVKGGHLGDGERGTGDAAGENVGSSTVLDVLYYCGEMYEVVSPRLPAPETHGTGCTFSAALTASLARGQALPEAFKSAVGFVGRCLRRARQAGNHFPMEWRAG